MSESAGPKTISREAPAVPLGRRLRYHAEAAGFFAIIGFFRLFDIARASAIGGWIGRNLIAAMPVSGRALANLRIAFPEKTPAELGEIVTAMWDNLGRVLAEYGHLDKIRWKGPKPRIELTGFENIEAAKARGKGFLIFSGHLANWEIMPLVGREYGFTGAVIVRPTNNPYINRWLGAVRSRIGMKEQLAKGPHGTRRAFALLRKGEAVCLLVDQRASEGIPVPFFGRDAFTTPAPAALALKLGAVLLPISNVRTGNARFHVHAHPMIEPPNTGDPDRDLVELTAAITRFIESCVRERPGEWLWIHRRWVEEDAPLRKRALALSLGRPSPGE
jgi:Kdo2-lipid IVA lauroyltransferase/acyltransferase